MSEVEIEITGVDAVVEHVDYLLYSLSENIRTAVLKAAVEVEERVQEKLAGEVLNEHTHHLHESIHHEVIRDNPDAFIVAVGTDIVYAAIHEYGFDGIEQVRAHLRRMSVVENARGRARKGVVSHMGAVEAYSRHMHMPERSYLRSSLQELAPDIIE